MIKPRKEDGASHVSAALQARPAAPDGQVRLHKKAKSHDKSNEKRQAGDITSPACLFSFCSFPYLSDVCRNDYSQGYFGRSFGKA